MNIWHEVLGYLGMALVLLSMMMNNVEKLRLLNLSGSIISMIYGILTHTWPTAILNLGLAVIHVVKLIQLKRKN
jgi:hypothetical protein